MKFFRLLPCATAMMDSFCSVSTGRSIFLRLMFNAVAIVSNFIVMQRYKIYIIYTNMEFWKFD